MTSGYRGTDKGFELDKTMTRGEATVMITRLLGSEKEVLEKNYTSPFKDVPDWVAPYIGWLYENKLTSGVSKTEYGTAQNISFEQYVVYSVAISTRASRMKRLLVDAILQAKLNLTKIMVFHF